MKKILLLTLAIVVGLLTGSPALAQTAATGQGITISPPLQEIDLAPGQTYQELIKINNPTNNIITVYPVARNFSAQGESGIPTIEAPSSDPTYGLATWISFAQSKLALTPQQEMRFSYTITVPATADPGGHYAAILFASEPPPTNDQSTQVALASMVGSLILATVPGNITEAANVQQLSADKFIYFSPPVNFTLKIQNTGNVHIQPAGTLEVKNWGQTVASLDINPAKGNVLPSSIRKFDNLKFSGNRWSFGMFTVNLAAQYGSPGKPLTGKIVFWIIPWWLITIVALVLLTLILLIINKRRKRGGRKTKLPPPAPPQERIVIR